MPGQRETLRINGRATITRDERLRAALAMNGVGPALAIVVETDEVYMHCARAFMRSGLWQPETWPDAGMVPGMAEVLHEKLRVEEPLEAFRDEREANYRGTLY